MTRHLSDGALLELAERGSSAGGGTAPDAHVAACSRCRERLDAVRDALKLAREVAVPEPSPLFWEHLSARVRESIASEDVPHSGGVAAGDRSRVAMSLFARWRPAVAAMLVLVCAVVAAWWTFAPRDPGAAGTAAQRDTASSPAATAITADAQPGPADLLEPASDPSWTLIGQVAGEVDLEHSVVVQPGTTDRAVLHLSADEQREFMRLLQTDLDEPLSQ